MKLVRISEDTAKWKMNLPVSHTSVAMEKVFTLSKSIVGCKIFIGYDQSRSLEFYPFIFLNLAFL